MPQWVSKIWEVLKATCGTVTAWSCLVFAISWTIYQVVSMHEAQLIPIQSENSVVIYGTMTLLMVPGLVMSISFLGIVAGVVHRLGRILLPEKLQYLLDWAAVLPYKLRLSPLLGAVVFFYSNSLNQILINIFLQLFYRHPENSFII